MNIYPAIDIMNGSVVRLIKGEFDQATVYSDNAVVTAQSYEEQGAGFLHVVDLDGARHGHAVHLDLIKAICDTTDLSVQAGGGVRSAEAGARLLATGVRRIVIGSIAAEKPEALTAFAGEFGPDRLTLAVDCIAGPHADPVVVFNGWQQKSSRSLWQLLSEARELGIRNILCTDVSRDGMMSGCNTSLYGQILAEFPDLNLQASGGMRDRDEVVRLRNAGVSACIIGKALYEGTLTIRDALSAAEGSC